MKSKVKTKLLAFFILAGFMVLLLNQCKNVGPSDWPEPTPDVSNQLKLAVFESDDGAILQGYDIKVILPDGTTKEFSDENGTLTMNGDLEGNYIITAVKDGYLAENATIEIESVQEDNVSSVTHHEFFLNKRGNSNLITPQGVTLTVENDLGQPTTVDFPAGSLSNDENVEVTFIQPPAKNGDLKILGERALIKGYNFSPDLTFPENAKPTINIPIDIPAVQDGGSIYFGNYDEETGLWEEIVGTLNAERTVASFEMPHFSSWYSFTGYRLVKAGTTWSPWTYVAESDTCGSGACGTFIYAVSPNGLIGNLISFGYSINLKAKDTRCVGPHYHWAQVLYARCKLVTYNVYDYEGTLLGSIQLPMKKFQWMVDEYNCHDQGGGS